MFTEVTCFEIQIVEKQKCYKQISDESTKTKFFLLDFCKKILNF